MTDAPMAALALGALGRSATHTGMQGFHTMGRKQPMTIAGKFFEKKGDAEAHAKNIRQRYLEMPGVPFSAADHEFIVDYIVQVHADAEEKIGMGVAEIVMLDVEENYRHGVNGADGRVLHFVRHDGTKVPVSLRGKRTHRSDVMQAFRQEVGAPPRGNQCEACESTEGPFHAHHVNYEFAEIVQFFLEANDLKFEQIQVTTGVSRSLVDRRLAYSWGLFHGSHAEYETLCRKCHYENGHGWKYGYDR